MESVVSILVSKLENSFSWCRLEGYHYNF